MKKIIKKIVIFFLVIILFFVFSPDQIFSQRPLEVDYPEIQGFKPETIATLIPDYVKYIFNFSIAVIGLIGLGALIVGGIRYLTSAGSPEQRKSAKKQIIFAFLGMLLLLFSYLILTTINPQLVIFRPLGIGPVPPTPPIEPPISVAPTADLLGRIKELAEAIKRKANEMKSTAEKIVNLTNNCDCNTTQSLCLCKRYVPSPEWSEWSEWYDNVLSLEEAGISFQDTLVPSEIDASLVESKGCSFCELLLDKSNIIVNERYFSDSDLQALESSASKARGVFGSEYQDKINSNYVFVFSDQQYKNMNEAMADGFVERGELSWDDSRKVESMFNQLSAYNTENNVTIMNGERVLRTGIATDAFIHEYAHAVDRTGPTSFQFSDSLEYREIFDAANSRGRNAFVSDYATFTRQEDFSDTVMYYYRANGDASLITTDPTGKVLIQERFDFLEKKGIVRPQRPGDSPVLPIWLSSFNHSRTRLSLIGDSYAFNRNDFSDSRGVLGSRFGAGSCEAAFCYSGAPNQPCPDDQQIKANQQAVFALKDEMLYYKNRALAEREDLKENLEKILYKEIEWYANKIKAETAVQNQLPEGAAKELTRFIIKTLEQDKAKLEKEKDIKERVKEKLLELANAIEELREPGKKISALPNECLTNVPSKCQGSCKGGCHDTLGCFPGQCGGGNPCPTQEIQEQSNSISNSVSKIIRIADEIIEIISEIR